MTAPRVGILLLLLCVQGPAAASAQDPLDAAHALRDAGRFAAAADTVRAHLRRHPEDAGARWMLGRLLYWSGEHRDARRAYEGARAITPYDPWLELDYASVLLALEEWEGASDILHAVVARGPPEARIRARTLLGTLAYWRGDLSTAARRFEAVLADDPDQEEAARGLREIRELTAPWIGIRLDALDDDQPYRRGLLSVDGGVFVTPLVAVAAGVSGRTTDAGTVRTSGEGWLELRGTLPGLRLDVSVRGGGVWAAPSAGEESTWIGRGELAFRLPAELELQAVGERERYLWTRTSADTLLMVEAVEAAIDRSEAPGWAGRGAVRLERFPDGNRVRTAYAWVLVPLGSSLRVGYAFSWSDADESTWTTAGSPGPGTGGTIEGRYDPYFTPEETRVHSLLAELSGTVGAGTARLSGAWAVSARELAPVLTASATGAPALGFSQREYTPWRVTASWTAPVTDGLALDLRGEHRRTAFYRLTRVEGGVVYRFTGAK